MTKALAREKRHERLEQDPLFQDVPISAEQITTLATFFNENVNVPFKTEEWEQEWFEWLLAQCVHYVQGVIGARNTQMLFSAADGVTLEEAEAYRDVLVTGLTALIRVPFIPKIAIRPFVALFVDVLLKSLLKGQDLESVLKQNSTNPSTTSSLASVEK